MHRPSVPTLAGTAAITLTAAAAYRLALRPHLLAWGATPAEVHAWLPGDELLPEADGVSTRAVSIAARAENVYPWIVQMGPAPRGGAYTYDWIENLLGLNFHSVDEILPEFQNPQVGEEVSFGPNTMRIYRVDRNRTFVLSTVDGNWVWSFNLLDEPGGGTRLISRNRYRYSRAQTPMMELLIPGSLVMERKMLLGVRDRAEAG